MLLIDDRSASTKNKMAPLLAAGRYPSLNLSISKAVLAPSFSFSDTYKCIENNIHYIIMRMEYIVSNLLKKITPSLLHEFLKWNNPPSNFGTVHYKF